MPSITVSRDLSLQLLGSPKFGFEMHRLISLGFTVEVASCLAAAIVEPSVRARALAFVRTKHQFSSMRVTETISGFAVTQEIPTVLLHCGQEVRVVPIQFFNN